MDGWRGRDVLRRVGNDRHCLALAKGSGKQRRQGVAWALQEVIVGDTRQTLFVCCGCGFVLLRLANVKPAAGARVARGRELVVRAAVGAGGCGWLARFDGKHRVARCRWRGRRRDRAVGVTALLLSRAGSTR